MQTTPTPVIAPAAGSDPDAIDLRTVFAVLRLNLVLFASVFAAVFVLVMGVTFVMPAQYTSTSSVMIGGAKVNATPTAQDVNPDLPTDSTQVDTEVEVLKSLSLADTVVQNLHLDKDAEFNPALAKDGIVGSLKKMLGRGQTDTSPEAVHQAIISNLLKAVSAKRQGLTRVITVSVETSSPVKSAQIADAWLGSYLTHQISNKADALTDANSEVGSRLAQLREEATDADNKVAQYKIAHNLTSSDDVSLPEQQLSFVQQQLTAANMEVAENDARLAAARRQVSQSTDSSLGNDALNSETLRDLRTHSADVSSRLAQLKSRYGPMHPEVIKATEEQKAIDAQIAAERGRVLSNIQTEDAVAHQKQRQLYGALGASRGTLNSNMSAHVELSDLQSTADAAHTVYESYLQHYKEMTSQQGLENANAKVLAKAKVPTEKSSPKMALALLLAVGLAAVLAAVAVFVKFAMRTGISSGMEVLNQLGVPYLGMVAELNSTLKTRTSSQTKLWDYIEANPLSVFAEQYKILLTAINSSKASERKQVIAVTSAIPGEGKTTTSICMAKTANMLGKSVVVVDCDLRRRSVSATLAEKFDVGLIEVLDGTVTLDKALCDGGKGVIYLPLSTQQVPSGNVFGSPQMTQLLADLKARFDLVVLDTAPVLPIVDTRILAHQADITVVLAKWNDTPLGATRTALDILHNEGVENIAGVALTLVDIKKQSVSSGIGSEYYYNTYKNYYTQQA